MTDNHKKLERIQLRVTPDEKETLRGRAQSLNMSLSEFMVKTCLDGKLSLPPSQINQEFVRQLARIGNNINQLTRHANTHGKMDNIALWAAVGMLNELRDKIR